MDQQHVPASLSIEPSTLTLFCGQKKTGEMQTPDPVGSRADGK